MFEKNFYANRSVLDNEFIQTNFDPSTGLSPEEIDMRLKELFDQKIENTSTAILRAEMFAFLYGKEVLDLLECHQIPPQEVTLNPSIFRKEVHHEIS